MQYRELGRTGWKVSEISFGAWAIGADWGAVDDKTSIAALERSIELGVNFIDTADVYGDGRSERLVAEVKRRHKDRIYVATKAGRRLKPHIAEGYNRKNIEAFVDHSLKNLETDALDLLQLHCPPTEVYYRPELFAALDELVADGVIAHYGVSVEKVEEAQKALEYPGLASVQIIFNIVRQRPAERFLADAAARDVGVLARVPLASGLLSGKYRPGATFPANDWRSTFEAEKMRNDLEQVERIRQTEVPAGVPMAQWALAWCLKSPAVSAVIPGCQNPAQVAANAVAAELEKE